MSIEVLQEVLGWCIVINLGVLLLWAVFMLFAHDFTYRLQTRWFSLSEKRFDAIHFSLMGFYKLLVIVFLVSPYLALHIIGS